MTGAVIEHDGRVLVAQRNPGDPLSGKWEFPGGKIEPGETPERCLVREIREELGIEVRVEQFLCLSRFGYDHVTVELLAYRCAWVSGEVRANAHQAILWATAAEIAGLDLAEADLPIARRLS